MKQLPNKILIIQTAFIGDVILMTSLLESIHHHNNTSSVDILVRKGNESLFLNHPFIRKTHIWEKRKSKFINLFRTLKAIRKEKYGLVVNLQRFASSGFLTAFSKAEITSGFINNPFSFLFTYRYEHNINGKDYLHEVERNATLISEYIILNKTTKPALYPSINDNNYIDKYSEKKYLCIAPASVWFTKQFPAIKWIELINECKDYTIYILGSNEDNHLGEYIKEKSVHHKVLNLTGKLSLLQTAALMKSAKMNYVNDSAPLHIASAMNAPVTAVFCSTSPKFGFYPLSDNSQVIQSKITLKCKPCGLHGFKKCPEKHFKCAFDIDIKQLLSLQNGRTDK